MTSHNSTILRCISYLPSAHGPDVLHQLAGLQLKCSAALHLLIPQLYGPALFGPANHMFRVQTYSTVAPFYQRLASRHKLGTHGRSFPPVTMSPSLSVVYMVKTGPLCAFATTRTRKCSRHTYTSPFIAPVKVRLFWRGQTRTQHPPKPLSHISQCARTGVRALTAPKATDSMVCMRPSSTEPITPFL